MHHKWLLSIILLSFAISTHAAASINTEGNCARVIGSWYGTFTLKDPKECRLYHGCTHGLSIHVNHLNGSTYQADVSPQAGPRGSYPINCANGKITSSTHTGSTIEFNCPDATICTVKYNDEKQSASLVGAGID